ncbi:MAG: chromosome segregation protein SMC, partial [Gammaproteobacteria bacterium]
HSMELRHRQQTDLTQIASVIEDLHLHIDRDEAQIRNLSESLGELGPGLEAAQATETASAEALRSAETDMQAWQSRWDGFNEEAGEASQTAEVEKAKIEQIETQMHRLVERRERRASEIARLQGLLEGGEIAQLEAEERDSNKQASDLEKELDDIRAEIENLRDQEQQGFATLDEARGDLQRVAGELASLEALQEAALGRKDGAVMEWLEGRGLGDQPRLAEQLVVDDGWEAAAETVLGGYLEAVCVNGLDDIASALDDLTHGVVSFLEAGAVESDSSAVEPGRILDKLRGPAGIERLLAGVRVANSLQEALGARSSLEQGESIVTRDGIWIGKGWLRFHRTTDAESGVIQREHEIRDGRQRLDELKGRIERLEEDHAGITEGLRALERRRDSIQGQINEAHRRHGDVHGRLASARARQEQTRSQISQFRAEAAEIDAHLEEAEEKLRSSRRSLETSVGQMSVFQARREELQNQRTALTTALEAARERAIADRNAAHEIAIQVESRKSTRDSANVALDRLRAQLEQSVRRHDELKSQLQQSEDPLGDQQQQLDGLLEQQVDIERELSAARDRVQETENRLRELQENRQGRERESEDIRASLDELRLAAREIQVRRQTVAEQFQETGFDLEALRGEMADDASIPLWEETLDKLVARIQRLGPINLASIDELKEQNERKEYLDSQFEDLTEALTTLENAIRRIDRETRTRFRETFDRVNSGMKEIFPRLFGGGHAYLELTGDDLLDSGVTVMARPPGKRISTIHLLSGGEKALTAVALVFAIFQLNPAPFCMLDEVDAPLDDANVGRFCDIVRDMSDKVQFIIITHNKVTMEMTHQLAGVTMHEPGVSRMVAVDLDEAVQMAAM